MMISTAGFTTDHIAKVENENDMGKVTLGSFLVGVVIVQNSVSHACGLGRGLHIMHPDDMSAL